MQRYKPRKIANVIDKTYKSLRAAAEADATWRTLREMADVLPNSVLTERYRELRKQAEVLATDKGGERHHTAFVLASARLEDLTLTVSRVLTSEEDVISRSSCMALGHDIRQLSAELQQLDPTKLSWLAQPLELGGRHPLENAILSNQRPQPPAQGLTWPMWHRLVLADAGFTDAVS